MYYDKHKKITRDFDFFNVLDPKDLPGYIKHYVLEDEQILVGYKTSRDHAIFSDKKIVLFDNYSKFGTKKQIYSIPYNSISTISITFEEECTEINLFLNCGHSVRLKFIKVKPTDKVRLRVLYTCINRIISNQEPSKKDIKRLINNDFKNN